MLSFTDWTSQQTAPKTDGKSFADWQTRSNPITLPDWQYGGYDGGYTQVYQPTSPDELEGSAFEKPMLSEIGAFDFLSDYYGDLSKEYLPTLEAFSKENAGKMVAFDPNKFMTPYDFGFDPSRGSLIEDTIKRQDGETYEDAVTRLLSQGGGTKIGDKDNRYDFMGIEDLDRLSSDQSNKWGKDYVNDPNLAKYVTDPNWVQKDENGNILSVRAELYPQLLKEQLGEEYRRLTRGNTKEVDGFGNLVGSLILGGLTGGFGVAGAGALGLSSAAAGAGLGATSAGLGAGGTAVAGALSGGLNSALTGDNILKGALTGGLTGGFSKWVSPTVGNTLSNLGITGTTNNVLTGGLTSALGGGLSSAVTGNQFNPISSFASGATQGYMGSQVGKETLGGLGITNPYAQRMVGSLASGAAGSLASGKNPNLQNMLANTGMKTFQQWLNDQSKG